MLLFWSAIFICAVVPTLQDSAQDVCSVCVCREEVDCSNLRMSSLPSLEKAASATSINFAHCSFDRIQQLPKLAVQNLSFAHNEVVKIDDAAFKNLASLQSLDLSFNFLTSDSLLPNVMRVSISLRGWDAVSYTHLTLPTIYSV